MATVSQGNESSRLVPPQFGLPALLIGVAAAALPMAIFRVFGPRIALAVLFAMATVVAHVAGNALGRRLRRGGAGRRARRSASTGHLELDSEREPPPVAAAPATSLSHHQSHGRFLAIATSVGAVGGIWLALRVLPGLHRGPVSLSSLLVACLACAALAGALAFSAFGLLRVFAAAWWEAHRSESRLRVTRSHGRVASCERPVADRSR